jgi:hypothetical protein
MTKIIWTNSAPTSQRSLPITDDAPTLSCLACGDTMQNLRSIPKFGVRREQLVFVCPSCNAVDTKELNGAQEARRNGSQSLTMSATESNASFNKPPQQEPSSSIYHTSRRWPDRL